jgi:predicted metal-dependent hydrolase
MLERNSMKLTIIRSNRKTISMRITGPDTVEIRAPRRMPQAQIDDFIKRHRSWIEKHIARIPPPVSPFTEEEIRALADKALQVIPERVRYYAALIGVGYGRITIRNQKSKWGSCSDKGNLNFNCLLMLCPSEVLDYVVVHELCHRKEMNHSPMFWAEVEKYVPDHKAQRKWLKDEGSKLIARL